MRDVDLSRVFPLEPMFRRAPFKTIGIFALLCAPMFGAPMRHLIHWLEIGLC